MKKERKKKENNYKLSLPEKKWRLLAQVSRISGHDSSISHANSFAAIVESRKCRFLRSALQTSLYDVRITTKISTTCTY